MKSFSLRLGMLHVAALTVGAFLTWASMFEIDQTVRSTGQVIPGARTQVIQAADGGVLAQLRVQEGERVHAGQVLAVLEPERARAAFEESRAKEAALQATLVRARAEAAGQPPVFGAAFAAWPDLVAAQTQLWRQRRQSLDVGLSALRETLSLAEEELRMNESLFSRGDTSRVELLRAQRQVVEIKAKMSELRNKYLQEARAEAAKQEEELSSQRYRREERGSVLAHTELRSPLDGIVKVLRVNTVGGVLRGGDELMQISPTDGELLVEVRINPADIGKLSPGLPASLQLDAFDYAVYGNLHGQLTYISSDTLTEPGANGQQQTYYRGRVRLDTDALQRNPKLREVVVKPGMTASVDIRTGQRTVLAYLLNPVLRGASTALSER
jgi:adhesin transport system membrane fusion protein